MRSSGGWCSIVLLGVLVPLAWAQPLGPGALGTPEGIEVAEDNSSPTDEARDKREVGLKFAAGLGVKNFLLDLVFGKVNQVIDYKTQLVTQFDRTNRYKNYYLLNLGTQPGGVASKGGAAGKDEGISTTTEDIPVFSGDRVSIDVPPELFGSSFTLVTNVSKVVGSVILNTAQRTQRFVDALKPVFGGIFNIETNSIDRAKRSSITSDVARLAKRLEGKQMALTAEKKTSGAH